MNKLLRVPQMFFISAILLSSTIIHACIWDADTLDNEKKKKPEIAEIIFRTEKEAIDAPRLQNRIAELKSNPRKSEAAWWNDLAGAYLRLGQPQQAANLLEQVVKKFDSDYGIHANLGTAYHLLGRYQEAEKEIARDLEINPDARFGLEKYHLALLQYFSRDQEYQKKHVYVDEWTKTFFESHAAEFGYDPVDTNFVAGVSYMASLNPKQPACFTMLGIACLTGHNFNLAVGAFEKAISLNSPQTEILQNKVVELKNYIAESHQNTNRSRTWALIAITVVLGIAVLLCVFIRRKFFKQRPRYT